MSSAARQPLGIVLSCTALIGFFAGFVSLNGYLTNIVGLVVYVVALLGAVLYIVAILQTRKSLSIGLLVLFLVGILGFCSTFGVMWYFTSYLPSSGAPLFDFKLTISTPTPKRP